MKNKFKKIKIGVEVECVLNKEILHFIERGHYHDGIPLINQAGKAVSGWDVERDGSVSYGEKFNDPSPVEFVSNVFESKRDFFKGIDRLIKTLSCDGKYELNKVMDVNKSCGCHVHFSKGNRTFAKTLHSYMYEKATKDFFTKIKKSTLPQYLKTAVLKQYYRDYARKSDKRQFNKNRIGKDSTRKSEWNFNSERGGNGMEWRSFNVNEVKTWKDFKALMSIAFDIVGDMLLGLKEWKKGNIYKKEIVVSEVRNTKRVIEFKKTKNVNHLIKINRRENVNNIIKIGDGDVLIKKRGNVNRKIDSPIVSKIKSVLGGD